MPTPELKWIRTEVRAPRGSRLRMLAAPAIAPMGMAAMDMTTMQFELPDLSGFPTPIEKVRLLLHSAAEIEHALLVQYLYAAYSLKNADELADPQQKAAVAAWRGTIAGIAREEMGHLMTVQNLLLFTRQPLNFEREDFPPRKKLYPFPMHLEPLTQLALAKYVVAESPVNAEGIADIITKATGAAGMIVNRVGVLYGLLGVVFSTQSGLDKNAANGDDWYELVRELAHRVYEQQAPEHWHLPSNAFDKNSTPRQATDQGWAPSAAMRVFAVNSRQDCLAALRDVGLQGEGPTSDPQHSHFERFRVAYRGDGALPAFPTSDIWTPARDVPIDPQVISDPAQARPNDISLPATVAWAQLANERYGLLLGLLEQYLHTDPNDRDWIRTWCLDAMPQLRELSVKLTTLDRAAGAPGKAAMPFNLPTELHLPATAEERRQLQLARLQASVAAANTVLKSSPADPLVSWIKKHDVVLMAKFGGDAGPGSGPDSTLGGAEAAMKTLLERKQGIAQFVHSGVAVGSTTLAQLFKDKNYDAVLNFLQTGMATRPPFAGKKLIEPGKPMESGFYLQVSQPSGVMEGQFDAEETKVVEDWIQSLAAVPPVAPPGPPAPPPATDPRACWPGRIDVERHAATRYNSRPLLELLRQGSTTAMFTLKGKLLIGVGLVLAMVATLTISSLWAILSYREVVIDLDRNLNKVPQRRELIEAFAALMEPLLAELPEDDAGRTERQWQFEQRLLEADRRTNEALRKLADLPPLPELATTRDLTADRLWEIGRRLKDLRSEQRQLLHPNNASKTTQSLLWQVGKLQGIAAGLPEFGTGLPQLLDSSRMTYRASFWWVLVSTGLVLGLLVCGFFAGRRWISRPWKKLLEGTHRVAQGKFEYRVQLNTRDEFAELADSFNRMADRFVETRDRLKQDAQELAEQLTRQERLAGLGFLAAGIAHELNNPLTAIRWTSESLLSRFATMFGQVTPQHATLIENYLKMIQSESSRCQQITAKLLDFARGGEGQRANHDVTQIIREVIHLIRAMSKYRQCEIVFDRSEPCVLEVNGSEIKQVVLNLVANALDAIEDASHHVDRRPRLSGPMPANSKSSEGLPSTEASTAAAGRLEIRLTELTDHIELEFQDSGCGMSADVLRKIFNPFFTTKPTGQGTGLGLPICHRIVTEHGGRLAATSSGPGQGSTFRLSLPRTAISQQKAA